jgi:hypothetical protein
MINLISQEERLNQDPYFPGGCSHCSSCKISDLFQGLKDRLAAIGSYLASLPTRVRETICAKRFKEIIIDETDDGEEIRRNVTYSVADYVLSLPTRAIKMIYQKIFTQSSLENGAWEENENSPEKYSIADCFSSVATRFSSVATRCSDRFYTYFPGFRRKEENSVRP